MPTRRKVLAGIGAGALITPIASPVTVLAETGIQVLKTGKTRQQIAPASYDPTELWTFGGSMPGPVLRGAQGSTLQVRVENGLDQPTSVHWHGLRLDNAMDGVPGLTQDAIPPGGSFNYALKLPDAGTYWYHSHAQSVEQVERGLYGALIVDEAEGAPQVDQDLVLVLDDMRLTRAAQLAEPFDNPHDRSHSGRIGNLWICNGEMDPAYPVNRGDRLRLRLISAANARIFTLGLEGFEAWIVALDGMPLAEPEPLGDQLVLAPAQRVDVIADVTSEADEAFVVTYEQDGGYAIATFPISGSQQARRPRPLALPPNPEFPIDLAKARTAKLLMEGGAMGGLQGALLHGEMLGPRELAMRNVFWAFNGVAHDAAYHGDHEPLLDLALGESARIAIANDTVFAHAMHLHGMHFSEVLPDGTLGPLRDTLLVEPQSFREIAFAAHNPGNWLFHCHMLSHHAAGMGTWVRVG